MKADKILATILQEKMELPVGRIVVYDKNFKAPKDSGLYITISTGIDNIISSTNKFDNVLNQEVLKVSRNTTFNVEITSKNNDAKDRRHEVLMAINSNYAVRMMEDNNVKIFRTKTIQDLSFIEGSSSLHRYRIPVIINNIEVKRSSTDYYEHFQEAEVIVNE